MTRDRTDEAETLGLSEREEGTGREDVIANDRGVQV
jgi:hypothetical protein